MFGDLKNYSVIVCWYAVIKKKKIKKERKKFDPNN